MANDVDERLAGMKAQLAQQNDRWRRARQALALMGDAAVPVPREFFQRIDALLPNPVGTDGAIRG